MSPIKKSKDTIVSLKNGSNKICISCSYTLQKYIGFKEILEAS